MSQQITVSFIDQFSQGIRMLSQQMTSRTREACVHEPLNAKKKAVDQVGIIHLVEGATRHAEIEQVETPHKRRWVTARLARARDFIDEADKLELLNDPTNAYTQAIAGAAARHWDRKLIGRPGELGGLLGDNLIGEEGDTKVSLPIGTPNVNQVGDGSAYLSFAMIKTGVRILRSRNALNLPGDTIHFATNAYQEDKYIDDNKVSNRDFTMKVVVDEGGINQHYRVKFHYLEDVDASPMGQLLPRPATDQRYNVMWVRSGAMMGVRKDAYGRVAWLHERESFQVSGGINIGSTRLEEKKVVPFLVKED